MFKYDLNPLSKYGSYFFWSFVQKKNVFTLFTRCTFSHNARRHYLCPLVSFPHVVCVTLYTYAGTPYSVAGISFIKRCDTPEFALIVDDAKKNGDKHTIKKLVREAFFLHPYFSFWSNTLVCMRGSQRINGIIRIMFCLTCVTALIK